MVSSIGVRGASSEILAEVAGAAAALVAAAAAAEEAAVAAAEAAAEATAGETVEASVEVTAEETAEETAFETAEEMVEADADAAAVEANTSKSKSSRNACATLSEIRSSSSISTGVGFVPRMIWALSILIKYNPQQPMRFSTMRCVRLGSTSHWRRDRSDGREIEV